MMKIKYNKKMQIALKNRIKDFKFHSEILSEIAKNGFEERNGCLILKDFSKRCENTALELFPDKTGYECFINSLHIEDYSSGDSLDVAIGFVFYVFNLWGDYYGQSVINAILAADDESDDVVVKFHELRSTESWLADDLEGYSGGVLVINSKNFGELMFC